MKFAQTRFIFPHFCREIPLTDDRFIQLVTLMQRKQQQNFMNEGCLSVVLRLGMIAFNDRSNVHPQLLN